MIYRADSKLAPNQWEMSLQNNIVALWLGANQDRISPDISEKRAAWYGPWVGSKPDDDRLKFHYNMLKSWHMGALLALLALYERNPTVTIGLSLQKARNAELWCFICLWGCGMVCKLLNLFDEPHFNGWVQERLISSVSATELHLSGTNPSI